MKCMIEECPKMGDRLWGMVGARLCSEHYEKVCVGHRAAREFETGPLAPPTLEDVQRWAKGEVAE